MHILRLYVEDIAGEWYAWIEDFPGAFSRGATPEEATYMAPRALEKHATWLCNCGDTPSPTLVEMTRSTVRIEVMETHHALPADGGHEVNGFFRADAIPLAPEDLETYLHLLACSYEELLRTLRLIPPDEWQTAPFGGKSICWTLSHMAEKKQAMLRALGITPTEPTSRDALERWEATRQEFEGQIRALPDSRWDRIMLDKDEEWTLRKAFRRALWHERYHAAQIAARANPTEFLRAVVIDRPSRGSVSYAASALPY